MGEEAVVEDVDADGAEQIVADATQTITPVQREEPGQEGQQRHQMIEADADDVDPVQRHRLALGVGLADLSCGGHVGHGCLHVLQVGDLQPR